MQLSRTYNRTGKFKLIDIVAHSAVAAAAADFVPSMPISLSLSLSLNIIQTSTR